MGSRGQEVADKSFVASEEQGRAGVHVPMEDGKLEIREGENEWKN